MKRRVDEYEWHITGKASRYTCMFYSTCLLIWTFYDMITKGKTGWEFPIMATGSAIFFAICSWEKRKLKNLEDDEYE
ncbi:hypothetical protein [Bacillus multifaciens]|uniref:hypothetical protein n=1 Tax=Bacillus multifaciens TaxID=3068506 RepID=UPI002741907E|nr:hypothetical protein [Bacillus sp. WLY-B-L8]MDP7979654.1 hypothetical protein [Bacillus sp. WLY-B-L8]